MVQWVGLIRLIKLAESVGYLLLMVKLVGALMWLSGWVIIGLV